MRCNRKLASLLNNYNLNMEWTKIPMFDRFDTISHIMPYYSHTHSAFLLLSSLCSTSRWKLDEFYDEFIYCMRK